MASLTLTQEGSLSTLGGQDRNPSKGSRITNEEWELVKAETEQIYIDQDHTLAATRETIQDKYGLVASERKWKLKLKEWGFEKNLPAAAMKVLVAKAERRAVLENKETIFFHGKTQIAPERINQFKKRKTFTEGPSASPSQQTPANVFYFTPCVPCVKNPTIPSGGSFTRSRNNSDFNMMKIITIEEFQDFQVSISSFKEFHPSSNASTKGSQDVSATILDCGLNPDAQPRCPSIPSIYFRLNTLAHYVYYFCRELTWSPEELKLMYPEWYPGVARNIAVELLSVITDLSAQGNNSSLDCDSQESGLSAANNLPIITRTEHHRTLFNQTILSLFGICQRSQPSPGVMSKAFEMVDSIFQLKLDPLTWPLDTTILAQIFEAKGENDAAETCYRQAICMMQSSKEYNNQSDFWNGSYRELPEIQSLFGDFLVKMNREQEALPMLVNGCIDKFVKVLSLLYIGRTSSQARFFSWEHPDRCRKVLESLQALHLQINQDGRFDGVRARISQLDLLLRTGFTLNKAEEILLEFMRLGAAYSEIWMFDAADLVYKFASACLENFDTRRHAFQRACAFRDHAQHCEKLGLSADRFKQLHLAVRCIETAYHYDDAHAPLLLGDLPMAVEVESLPKPRQEEPGAGPREWHFESLAREDPELSRWMRGVVLEIGMQF